MKRSIAILACAAALLLILSGCGKSVKNDVPAADISAEIVSAIGMDGQLAEAPESYVKGFMQLDPEDFGECSVMINAFGTSADEFGVFKAGPLGSSGDVKSVEDAVNAYLQLRLDTWMDEYMPGEKPKLTGAKVETAGDYVIYCILSGEDAGAALEVFEKALG